MRRGLFWFTTLLCLSLAQGCAKTEHAETDHQGENEASHEAHAGEEHGGETEREHEEHAEEAEHAGHEEHEEHGDEGEIEVTAEAAALARITLDQARTGSIRERIELSGEVGFNEDRLVHITPRFAGIVKEARFRLGEYVNAGDVVAVVESNESMAHYSLKASISGRIIEKHAAPGEYASGEGSLYVLADLANVWVNLAVYPKHASKVRTGQKASITAVGSGTTAEGVIDYVTPVMDPQTRTIVARVVLPNGANQWRPGTFVHARLDAGEGQERLVVPTDAVQILHEKPVVFVSDEPNRYRPVEVVTGARDAERIEILQGLQEGDQYVNSGAFELKAKIVTGSLGSHAGHGH